MLCEHYKDALIEAAAGGATPSGELRAHLAECAPCRAAFAQEQSLFAGIDSSLHAAANAEVPTSFLAGVRARLDEVMAPRFRWVQPVVFASASAALVFAIFLMVRPHRVTVENVAGQDTVVAPTPVAPQTNPHPAKVSSANMQIASSRGNLSHTAGNSTNLHSLASSNPEVLVPPDEREGLAQLVATLNEHGGVAAALLAERPEKKDAFVTVGPLQISDMEIKPLQGAETEASDGTGEKH
jgi:predicted anti-sigma-YlaC factor YlaD